jgi:hypothetical protein
VTFSIIKLRVIYTFISVNCLIIYVYNLIYIYLWYSSSFHFVKNFLEAPSVLRLITHVLWYKLPNCKPG